MHCQPLQPLHSVFNFGNFGDAFAAHRAFLQAWLGLIHSPSKWVRLPPFLSIDLIGQS
jgi:hypothetical protein